MGGLYVCRALKIGNGSCDFQNPVVGPGGKAELVDGSFKEVAGSIVDGAVFFDVAAAHLGITVDFGSGKAVRLNFSGAGNASADAFRRLRAESPFQVFVGHCRHFKMNVDPIQQRAADLGHVSLDLRHRTVAVAAGVNTVALNALTVNRPAPAPVTVAGLVRVSVPEVPKLVTV